MTSGQHPNGNLVSPFLGGVGNDGAVDAEDEEDKDVKERRKEDSKQEDEGNKEGDEVEMRRPRVQKRPTAPTKQEIEDHMPLHLPPRDWCPHCVSGHGIAHQHRRQAGDTEILGTTISMDYAFLIPEEKEDGICPVLIMYDNIKEAFWALAVEEKGVSEIVVNWARDRLDDAGYRGVQITLKSDQVDSIVALKKAVAAKRMVETGMGPRAMAK